MQAQEVRLDISDRPLNEVFIELKYQYNVNFSFNDKLLAECFISETQTFGSIEEAIRSLVGKCGLEYELIGEVFVIRKQTKKPPKRNYKLIGQVVDAETDEPLPFSAVRVNRSGLASNVNGSFSFVVNDSVVPVSVSHVGYYQSDLFLSAVGTQTIRLKPQSINLNEVVVLANAEKPQLSHIIERPSVVKLNRRMAAFLPGSSDNTIINLLRLQPGILASGEQTNDFTIWGSYKGQSHVIYDGITLFNFSSISDNIGAVNPLMISDIEVLKGGYNVNIGNRVGGVVNITSTEGRTDRVHGTMRISDQSAAVRLNVPLGKGLTIQAAGRYVFPQNFGTLVENGINGQDGKNLFVDANLKLTGRLENGDNFHLSLIGAGEQMFQSSVKLDGPSTFESEEQVGKYQVGGSAAYAKRWKRFGTTRASLAYSHFESTIENAFSQEDEIDPNNSILISSNSANSISELNVKLEHQFVATKVQSLSVGAAYIRNQSVIVLDSSVSLAGAVSRQVSRANFYVKDDVRIGRMITLEPGLRLDVTTEIPKGYFQPRFAVVLVPNKHWRLRFAWGMYNQFIAENALVDVFGNELYFWQVADGTGTFVQRSMHNVAGVSFSKWGLNVALEGYYKMHNSLIRWSYDQQNDAPFFHANGEGRSFGFDVTVKKQVWKLDLSAVYSWSKSEDAFNSISNGTFQPAPHDQRHEAKAAAVLNLNPFFVSLNYVYGSGFPLRRADGSTYSRLYSRLDAAFLYQKKLKSVTLETGISILNVTNTNNVRYSNVIRFANDKKSYQSAMGITPLLFFSVNF
ncbi:MAG: hypothetical protein ACI9UR_002433 [Bacteroidia bacterium]